MRTPFAKMVGTAALFVFAAMACNGMVGPSVGSETNWVGACTSDADCATLSCVCGLCTRACDATTACPGVAGQQTCAEQASNAFGTVCGGGSEKPGGVCLRPCTTDLDCNGATRCEDDACVPISAPKASGSSQTMAALEATSIGTPCAPEDEKSPDFPGYNPTETIIEDHSLQCASGICIAVFFRGRVTCPYGQPPDPANTAVADPAKQQCRTTGTNTPVNVPVQPQLASRRPDDAVYCSCRCDGPEGTGPFCACPDGFECTHLVEDIGKGHRELAGSYCLKPGTMVPDPIQLNQEPACSPDLLNCGPLP